LRIICAWCKKEMGEKLGTGETHGICEYCRAVLNEQINQELKLRLQKERRDNV